MRQLGAAVGVSHVFVRQVETGASPLPRGRAQAFAAALGLSVAGLTELDPATLAPHADEVPCRCPCHGGAS